MISWASRKHKFVTLNTVEVEYIATCDACREVVWLCKMVFGLFDQVLDSTMIYCDNQSCVKLSENLVFHDKLNHIERMEKGEVKLYYISTDEKITYIMMKALSKGNFVYFRDKLGLVEITPLVEREY
jgi:hypothetical protein